MNHKKIKIGTRGSKLALQQTLEFVDAIKKTNSEIITEIIEIRTSGDWKPEFGEKKLSEISGGKGLFVKEIEQALLSGQIDCAVHSMKDVPSSMTSGLVINHMLPREVPNDAFIASGEIKTINDLPQNAIIGTSSARRQAFACAIRDDLKIVPFRGNVPTRLEKVKNGQVDATFLAVAGLKRLGLSDKISSVMDIDDMLPAAGQGAIGIQIKENETNNCLIEILNEINCMKTLIAVTAERSALEALSGSCHTPVGSFAQYQDKTLYLRVKFATIDGKESYSQQEKEIVNTAKEAYDLGKNAGNLLRSSLPEKVIQELL